MSNLALFASGAAVTLLTLSGLVLLVIGAVLDGRDARAARAAETSPATGAGHLAAVPRVAYAAAPNGRPVDAGSVTTIYREGDAA
jgi:hypothetical protein